MTERVQSEKRKVKLDTAPTPPDTQAFRLASAFTTLLNVHEYAAPHP